MNAKAALFNRTVERVVNKAVRGIDAGRAFLHIGGRKADYDDTNYQFIGGAGENLRRKHYDKSLRFLWKAEEHASWSSFKDCSKTEQQILEMALRTMTDEEKAARKRINSTEFREMLDREYTQVQKESLVTLLAAIGHGEAYAWLVSADVLKDVRSTGGKAAVTMQVMEEAKHFVVLRELIQAFGVEIRRQSVWEYLLLEQVLKAKGLEKFFGMNVLVEGIALSLFGLLCNLPGMEILKLFHLDESRHTALPVNYFKEFPMSAWQKHNLMARWRRLLLVLPAIPLIFHLEEAAAELGYDAFEFGGSVFRKVTNLSNRAGFYLLVPSNWVGAALNQTFNGYCFVTREGHTYRDFLSAETTRGDSELAVEDDIFRVIMAAAA